MATLKEPFALDRSLNTTEVTPRNIADVLAEELSRITGRNASQVEYDNTDSGLTADNVQDALDEIVEDIPTVPSVDIQTAVDEFETYNGGLLSECKVALTPNQDLHGYDSPWVGGSRKNKLPLVLADIKALNPDGTWNGNSYSISGMTFDVNTDDANNVTSIKINGSSTSVIFFRIITISEINSILNGSYIANGCPSGGSINDYYFAIGGSGNDYGSGVNISTPLSGTNVVFRVENGKTLNNIIFTPMIRLSTESDPTFEPYSNICPISGHTQVDVDVSDGQTTQEQVTVNLGGTYYSGTLDVVSGVFTPDTAEKIYNGTEAFAMTTGTNYHQFYISFPVNITKTNIICDSFKTIEFSERGQKTGIAVLNDPTIRFCFKDDDLLISTVGDFGTWLSTHNVEVVYPLANPTPIQLSPTMVKALVGENHLSAPLEGQEITESKYRELFTWNEVESYVNAHSGGGSGMNYSTEEQVIGTWIDGKPLYQKTWDFSGSPVMLSYADWVNSGIPASENIKSVISAELKYGSVCLASVEVGVNVDGYPIGFQHLDSNNTRGVSYCTLRYTKTTD